MAQVRILLLLGIALLTPTAAMAADASVLRAAPMTVSGNYSITFRLNIFSTLPAGTMMTCRVKMAPKQGGPDLLDSQLATIPVESTGLAVITGSTAVCAAEIPFAWTVWSAQGGVMLSYQIEAVSRSGSAPTLLKRSALQSLSAAFPASGSSASLSINVVF
ncbi:MAG: hypothetical protein ABSF70_14415 [Terracidiphilus sp.]